VRGISHQASTIVWADNICDSPSEQVGSTLERIAESTFPASTMAFQLRSRGNDDGQMDNRILHIQHCMYQYSRAIYRSIKDLIDPYVDNDTHLEYRREVLAACEGTMERLAADPHYFAKPDRALFSDIRRYFPITVQAQVAWSVTKGVDAAVGFVEEQIEAGAFDGGVARCRATTRKGKACQRTPLPERDYCPSHQHLERSKAAA
jgi:hypothetical protein